MAILRNTGTTLKLFCAIRGAWRQHLGAGEGRDTADMERDWKRGQGEKANRGGGCVDEG